MNPSTYMFVAQPWVAVRFVCETFGLTPSLVSKKKTPFWYRFSHDVHDCAVPRPSRL